MLLNLECLVIDWGHDRVLLRKSLAEPGTLHLLHLVGLGNFLRGDDSVGLVRIWEVLVTLYVEVVPFVDVFLVLLSDLALTFKVLTMAQVTLVFVIRLH